MAGYLIERCQGASCSNFAQIATSTATGFSDTGLVAGVTYSYRVRATDSAGNLSPYSGTATVTTLGFTVTPKTATLTPILTQQFTATTSGITWSVDGVVGGNATSGTISTNGLYTPPSASGTHTITGTSSSPVQSVNATAYVSNYPGTYTRDFDKLRTGLNPSETVLTPTNVNAVQFGKLFSNAIDGTADASPLYVPSVNISGVLHNVVYVATEHDSVYAFDADGRQPPCSHRVVRPQCSNW